MAELPHLLGLRDMPRAQIESVLRLAQAMEPVALGGQKSNLLEGAILATLFYEPSTRTRLSFETAMLRLGGSVISVADAVRTSSAWKGESLADTIRTVDNYAHVIAIRHSRSGAAREAAEYSRVPIINAGDGTNEHPTQGLLDLLTVMREFGRIDGLNFTIVGDLKHTRSTNSLAYGLANFEVDITFVSPPGFEPGELLLNRLDERGVPYRLDTALRKAVANADVIYVCRVQTERIDDPAEIERIKGSYVLNMSVLREARKEPIVLHHLPRVGELSEDVDEYSGARYFKQPWNGVLTRMALLIQTLGKA
ncbi:MAG TPA: aspartate carbamoyltransferase [Thermoleophilia bacterium]|nr:aspartate carbamoyltransferase [Thermoleophilia bacterium]